MMSEWDHRDESSAVVESEHVVEAEETSTTTREKMEDLSKFHWVLTAIDEQVTWNEAEDTVVNWWLSIKALDGMLNLAERAEFVKYSSDTLELFTLETEHRVVSVQLLELLISR